MIKFADEYHTSTRRRLERIGNYYIYVTGAGGRYKRSNVWVIELNQVEEVKLLCNLTPGEKVWFPGIRSKLIGKAWRVAACVHDGSTEKSKGFRARLDARDLVLKLINGGPTLPPPTFERDEYGNLKGRTKRTKKNDSGKSNARDGADILRDVSASLEADRGIQHSLPGNGRCGDQV